jgi:dTDP-4-amino-4,6-dideoxygalactose transaminase
MIPVFKPLIEQEEIKASASALEMGWLGMGSFVSEFEDKIKKIIGNEDKKVVAVSTGAAAIHLSLLLIGAGPGDEIITPSFNNICDFQSIHATGADIVFCDINENTLCIDLEKAEKLVTPKTKAIIAMDYDCILCDHDKVAEFARKHKIRVIHDACHSFGSKYKGKTVGSFSDITVFSFDPVKTITCIDGGVIVVNTEEEKILLHELRLIGMKQPSSIMYTNQRAWTYDVERLGFRYHMANIHAAIGIAQLSKLDRISSTRNKSAVYYNQMLKGVQNVIVPQTDYYDITPFLYYIRVPQEHRDKLRDFLKKDGIDTGIHWQPGHWFTLFKDCRKGDLSITDKIGKEILSLPFHSDMEFSTIDKVVASINSYFNRIKEKVQNEA